MIFWKQLFKGSVRYSFVAACGWIAMNSFLPGFSRFIIHVGNEVLTGILPSYAPYEPGSPPPYHYGALCLVLAYLVASRFPWGGIIIGKIEIKGLPDVSVKYRMGDGRRATLTNLKKKIGKVLNPKTNVGDICPPGMISVVRARFENTASGEQIIIEPFGLLPNTNDDSKWKYLANVEEKE